MKTKYTPGPWYRDERQQSKVRGETGFIIAEATDHVPRTQQEANARLIAAAPELLASCKSLVAAFWGAFPEKLRLGCRKDYPDHPVCRAESAIVKAEGKQP